MTDTGATPQRDLTWDGYINVRDLGGKPTPLSPTGFTLFGRVARGPRRERLTAHGWGDAARWGPSTIVDLRCAHEIGRRDGDPDGGITLDPASSVFASIAEAAPESVRAMAGTASYAPSTDRQALWTPEKTDDWIVHTSPIVQEAAEQVDVAFDQIALAREDRALLRALLTDPAPR